MRQKKVEFLRENLPYRSCLEGGRGEGVDCGRVAKYFESLRDLFTPEKYAELYLRFELNWLETVGGGAAEVFDRVYAELPLLNLGDPPEGRLVVYETPGVQRIIGAARKLGDLNAGSWLVSQLTWRTALKFVEKYGPDVLLSPSLRLHPYLKSYVERGAPPPHALMPERGVLLVKDEDESKIADAYYAAQEELMRLAEEGDEGLPHLLRKLRSEMGRAFKRLIRPRVASAEVRGDLEEVRRGLGACLQAVLGARQPPGICRVYGDPLWARPAQLKDWFDEELKPLADYEKYTGVAGYIMCSLCGREPALVRFRKAVGADQFAQGEEEKLKSLLKIEDPREAAKVVKPGEALGPLCIFKRALHYSQTRISEIHSLSTEDVAFYWSGWEKVAEALEGGECADVVQFLRMRPKSADEYGGLERLKRRFNACLRRVPQFQRLSFREHFALIVGDGDDVGERWAEAEAVGKVVELSTSITKLAVDTLRELNADGRPVAVPIYVGGDDVVVATSVEHLFETLKRLHRAEARSGISRSYSVRLISLSSIFAKEYHKAVHILRNYAKKVRGKGGVAFSRSNTRHIAVYKLADIFEKAESLYRHMAAGTVSPSIHDDYEPYIKAGHANTETWRYVLKRNSRGEPPKELLLEGKWTVEVNGMSVSAPEFLATLAAVLRCMI
ncbi:type III-B CRISPR-associated protein Cas10/Cmr2 [Pyrobaculum sp.]|uniref:type III-B CRISPR-associated protein Cas10/Cmr2 n=1 Tax=Pyrobaculum sp. TaxID=2004705 RepID=UPI003D10E17F